MPEKTVQQAAPRPVEIVRRCDMATGFQVLPRCWVVERTLDLFEFGALQPDERDRLVTSLSGFVEED